MSSETRRKRPPRPAPTAGILGLGRAGRALRNSLRESGYRVLGMRRAAPPPRVILDLLVLAVPDDRVAAESRRLARGGTRCRVALHLSGALGSSELAALRAAGAKIASFHPLRSFSGRAGESFRGCLVAIEGDPAAEREARRLARRIGAAPWRVDPRAKPLYHAAASVAAGGTAALIAAAAAAATAAGIPKEKAVRAFAALSASAAANVEGLGFPAGATGPLARGDRRTLRLHRRALRSSPVLRGLYREITRTFRTLNRR